MVELIFNQEVVEDKEIDDKRMFNIIRQIGDRDQIHSSIILEVDVPSNHDARKIPLDLKVWVEEIQIEDGSRTKKEGSNCQSL